MSGFKTATKKAAKARIALLGPAGSGKTFTALRLATQLAAGGKIAVIDTERGSASKYAGDANPDGGALAFDAMDDWTDFSVRNYIDGIEAAVKGGYAVLVIDSLSHAWSGVGGILEFVDAKKGNNANGFSAWRDATPLHNKLVEAILSAPLHIIVTMRTKMEYVQEKDANGKTQIRKVGMQPVQREGLEYEFDLICDCDHASVTISKSRCRALTDKRFVEPGKDLAAPLLAWLEAGVAPEPAKPTVHASWAADEPKWTAFVASLTAPYNDEDGTVDVGTIDEFFAAGKAPIPSATSQKGRDRYRELLLGAAGRNAFQAWNFEHTAPNWTEIGKATPAGTGA